MVKYSEIRAGKIPSSFFTIISGYLAAYDQKFNTEKPSLDLSTIIPRFDTVQAAFYMAVGGRFVSAVIE